MLITFGSQRVITDFKCGFSLSVLARRVGWEAVSFFFQLGGILYIPVIQNNYYKTSNRSFKRYFTLYSYFSNL